MVENEILNQKRRFYMLLGAFVSLHVSTRPSFVEIRLNPKLTFLAFETCCSVYILCHCLNIVVNILSIFNFDQQHAI